MIRIDKQHQFVAVVNTSGTAHRTTDLRIYSISERSITAACKYMSNSCWRSPSSVLPASSRNHGIDDVVHTRPFTRVLIPTLLNQLPCFISQWRVRSPLWPMAKADLTDDEYIVSFCEWEATKVNLWCWVFNMIVMSDRPDIPPRNTGIQKHRHPSFLFALVYRPL